MDLYVSYYVWLFEERGFNPLSMSILESGATNLGIAVGTDFEIATLKVEFKTMLSTGWIEVDRKNFAKYYHTYEQHLKQAHQCKGKIKLIYVKWRSIY